MNKRRLCLIAAVVLIPLILLYGCQSGSERKDLPVPSQKTIEKSENSFGARYHFTLKQINDAIEKDVGEYGIKLYNADWVTISSDLVDDNGVEYSSFCNRRNSITFTAAVENDNKKVMNFGCGCISEKLDDITYRSFFLRTAAVMAQHTGGYTEEDRRFLADIFNRLLIGDEDTLAYQGTLYIKSVYEGTTVLMTVPCSNQVISGKKYTVYTG